jgi:gliding motility-associated-like protein
MRQLFLLFISFLELFEVVAQDQAQKQRHIDDSINSLKKIIRPINLPNSQFVKSVPSPSESKKVPQPPYFNKFTTAITATTALCPDTSERFFIKSDNYYIYPKEPFVAKNGDLLFPGEYLPYTPPYISGAALLRTDIEGNVKWLKLIDSANNIKSQYHYYYKIIELADGSILAAGGTKNPMTDNNDLLLTKMNSNGNVIWTKTYNSRFWTFGSGSADYFYVQQMKQDAYSGDVFFCGPFWTAGKCIVRINIANGNIVWGKSYQLTSGTTFDVPFGIDIKQNEIIYFGKNSGYTNVPVNIYRINKANGSMIENKFLKSTDIKVDFLGNEELVKLSNGNYVISGKSYGYYEFNWNGITPLYHASVVEFDSSLSFVRAFNIRNPVYSNTHNTVITVYPDGSGTLNMDIGRSSYSSDNFIAQFSNGQIIKQRKIEYRGRSTPLRYNSVKLPDGGDLMVSFTADSVSNLGEIEFLKLHTSDTSSECVGRDYYQYSIYPFLMQPHLWSFDSVRVDPFRESVQKTFRVRTETLTKNPGCFIVSYCDSLDLSISDSTICLGDSILLSIHKNIACGTTVPISYDTSAVQSALYVNDSTMQFKFRKSWRGYISAALRGCAIMKDSVYVTVLKTPDSLYLGKDTALCPQNSILLNAKDGYSKYRWQDGSTDSTFTVTQPGRYYVVTEDACGNSYNDTVNVAQAPPVPLNIGPDRAKCNTDTLQLFAPTGFINYTWSPNYNISTLTSRQIVVNPLTDTSYYLKAEKTPGCFGFDTVKVKVNKSPAISLGNDTSFCNGQSITLVAGTRFASYQWSNGSANTQISVNNNGAYSVIGTTAEGCKSYDTLQVLNVFTNPVVRLNKDTGLCIGESKILDAGNFVGYLWNNGSTGQTIAVTGIGDYKVIVTDRNGCIGIDSSSIKTMYPLPALFLSPDTSVCSYSSLILQANDAYSSYVWSNNSVSSSIEIKTPGQYWLQVTDANNCFGIDTINVALKECMVGLYIPNAFTPDGNGLNDEFKPMLFGNVEEFRFTVYNRWGQVVFQSTDRLRGWDGLFKGVQQIPGLYAWTCVYKLSGEPRVAKSGTITLIR